MPRPKPLSILLALAFGSAAGAQEVTPVIEVGADELADARTGVLDADDPAARYPHDGGDWLLTLPGVTGVRMGSHGADPVIRGQSQTQLNVLLGGAFVQGGCPNRMDPPSSYASPEIYDRVTVIKGVQTLIYGAGGPGGTVLFERTPPNLSAEDPHRVRLGAGYASNGNVRDGFADAAVGGAGGYVRGIVAAKSADSYEDGDGEEVRSGYRERSAILDLGWSLGAATRLELSAEAVRGDDILYAGAGMDAPVSDNDTIKLRLRHDAPAGPFDGLRAELYRTDVEHVMDNFSLRPAPMMAMSVPSESLTDGGRVIGDVFLASGLLSVGVDLQRNQRDAVRYSGMMAPPTMIQSYLWPGVEIRQMGAFAEYAGDLSPRSRMTAAVRVDRVRAEAGKAALTAMGTSAADLYALYYGTRDTDHQETNVGALLRLERDLATPGTTVFATVSRTARTADATERFIASNNANPSQRWVGNPDLDPEIHRQLEAGVQHRARAWSASAAVYADRVRDYILRDRFHSADPALGNATIYRNVDARLAGLDAEVRWRWSRRWSAGLALAYVHATNTTDDRPIAQTPPLEGTLSVAYEGAAWSLGGALRAVARQTRVDDDPATGSGLDFGETPGFAVLDLYGSAALGRRAEVRFGMDNVFDRTYAEHLNKPNLFDPDPVRVNEPGRSVWVRASVEL